MLPIRPLATNPQHAVASLLVNQASMSVVAELGRLLAEKVGEAMREAGAEVEVVIGVPTLGLSVAGVVAGEMGFGEYAGFFGCGLWVGGRI
jgi:hypothetical protein